MIEERLERVVILLDSQSLLVGIQARGIVSLLGPEGSEFFCTLLNGITRHDGSKLLRPVPEIKEKDLLGGIRLELCGCCEDRKDSLIPDRRKKGCRSPIMPRT